MGRKRAKRVFTFRASALFATTTSFRGRNSKGIIRNTKRRLTQLARVLKDALVFPLGSGTLFSRRYDELYQRKQRVPRTAASGAPSPGRFRLNRRAVNAGGCCCDSSIGSIGSIGAIRRAVRWRGHCECKGRAYAATSDSTKQLDLTVSSSQIANSKPPDQLRPLASLCVCQFPVR